ncbi:MAG: hypothetical protein KAT34_02575 [Candidatus Aminicenantes bacterium]|nr:hypothetical protein [Candidatus Aminicenantes bacterium]
MKLMINIIISGINIFILSRYIYLLYHKKISPSLAMWTFFSLAVGISLFTYFADGDYNISDNILNFTDLILVVNVSIAILIWGDKTTQFNTFDLGCLAVVASIIVFWAVSNNHIITNFSVQSIMVISYFPVVKRMINQKKNTEAFSVWIALLLAPCISLISSKGLLASVYAIRAFLCAGTLLILMLRIEILNRKQEAFKEK